jgi:hypothetical protein
MGAVWVGLGGSSRKFRVHGRILAEYIPVGSVSGSLVAGISREHVYNTARSTIASI